MWHLRHSKLVIVIVLLLGIVAAWRAAYLEFHHELEAFFPSDDEDLAFNEAFGDILEPDDNFLIVGLERPEGIFDSSFLHQVHDFTLACDSLPHIIHATSLTQFQRFVRSPMGFVPLPFLHWDQPQYYPQDSLRIFANQHLTTRFLSADAKTIAVVMATESDLNVQQAELLNNSLFELIDRFGFTRFHVAGKTNTQPVFVKLIQEELVFYVLLCSLLIVVILTFLFRRFWGVLIAFVSVVLGMILFFGVLNLIGKPLDIMSSLFPTLMLVVGMSDVIHIFTKYTDELDKGLDRHTAMKITIKEIGLATFLTSLTTAIGFASLVSSKIAPVRHFGLVAGLGVFVAYFTVITFTTAMLVNFNRDQLVGTSKKATFWPKLMNWIYQTAKHRQATVIWTSVVSFLVCLGGSMLISTNTFLLSDIPDDAQPQRDLQFFEEHLGGIRTMEIAVIAKDGHHVNELDVLQDIEKISNYLETFEFVNPVWSSATLYRLMHQAYKGGGQQYFQLPDTQADIDRYERQLGKYSNSMLSNVLLNEDRTYGRISAKMQDLGSEKIAAFNQQVLDWIAHNADSTKVDFRITGKILLVDKNHGYLRRSLLYGLGIAFLVVSLLMAILFRNWKMVLVSLIPNVIPLLVAGAVMGIAGIELKASTSIIFTVAFGIAVDDTIHFLSKFKLARQQGMGVDEAIRNTYMETGKALILTTIILFFGFLVMSTSEFNGTVYIGVLVSVTLLSALITDLFLLPVCLYKLFPEQAPEDH